MTFLLIPILRKVTVKNMVQSDQNAKANNAEAIQFHAPELGVVEQLTSLSSFMEI